MSSMPPSGSKSTPSRARKSSSGVSSGFGAALREGASKAQAPSDSSAPKKTPQVRIARTTYNNLLATKLLKAFGVGLVGLFIVYLAFAVTIVRILPTPTVGFVAVKNITFPGGLIPAGEQVVVDMVDGHGTGMLDYLQQSFVPNANAAIVKVEAGPWGSFKWNDGIVIYDEQILSMAMPEEPLDTNLVNSYLVTCVEGACVPGQGYVIHSTQVLGQQLTK